MYCFVYRLVAKVASLATHETHFIAIRHASYLRTMVDRRVVPKVFEGLTPLLGDGWVRLGFFVKGGRVCGGCEIIEGGRECVNWLLMFV